MMVAGVSICSVCGAGGVVSFSGVVGCRRAGGVGLVVGGGGCLAAVGWRGCRLPPAFSPPLVDW